MLQSMADAWIFSDMAAAAAAIVSPFNGQRA